MKIEMFRSKWFALPFNQASHLCDISDICPKFYSRSDRDHTHRKTRLRSQFQHNCSSVIMRLFFEYVEFEKKVLRGSKIGFLFKNSHTNLQEPYLNFESNRRQRESLEHTVENGLP